MSETEKIIETPAEKIETAVAVMDAGGKPIETPISQADLAKAANEAAPKPKVSKEAILALMKEAGFEFTNVDSVAEGLTDYLVSTAKKQKRDVLKLQQEEDKKKLLAVHEELVAAVTPLIAKAGIKMDIPGKQLVCHVGEAGTILWDIAYPELPPDKASKNGKGNGKVRNASFMGAVNLRVPEKGINGEVAKSLSAFFSYFTGKPYNGYKTGTIAVQNIGDTSEGKSGQDGFFKVQNVPAVPETPTAKGSPAYNIAVLTDKGYTFFGIAKGKVAKATPAPKAATAPATEAPKEAAPVAINTSALDNLPSNWKDMTKAERKAWRHQNTGKAS